MSGNKNKDEILLEKIVQDLGVQRENAPDLVNLITILLNTNIKEELGKELREIYEGTTDIDGFIDFVWNLYKGGDQEESKSEYSDQNEKKPKTDSAEPSAQENASATNTSAAKKGRPAIYDEYERMQRVENVRNINMNAKKNEKEQKQNKPSPRHEPSNKNSHQPPNPYNKNGKRPLPPAPAKEEAKPSILDRIIKPGDKAKAASAPTQHTSSKPHIVLHTSKHEEVTKKFKPNPEARQAPVNTKKPAPAQKYTQPPVQKQALVSDIQQEEQPQNPEENAAQQTGKFKVRCRNWPNCKNEACIYHHPTENCKFFPACPYGNKCLYIHPQIPCKFGAYCQRPNCSYTHPRFAPQGNQLYGFAGKKPYKGAPNPENQGGNAFPQEENFAEQNVVNEGQ